MLFLKVCDSLLPQIHTLVVRFILILEILKCKEMHGLGWGEEPMIIR